MPIIDIIGFTASALVFLTFCMRTLLPLRLVAITSNIFFIVYGFLADLAPILTLHLLLLPMNLFRTAQQLQTRRRMRSALYNEPNLDFLLPLSTREDFADNKVVFHRGDAADKMYVVADGNVIVEDFEQTLPKGSIFGEVAFFKTDAKRTATVRTSGPTTLAWIDRETLIRLYRNNPDFALFLTRLMVTRLVENEENALNDPKNAGKNT
ncbi:Crp/Fnr family transcriptional regulator [Marivita geojedonensis]|uniref:Cyclic nucleotide-binding domain-containing protein n=1 Tax=Marivita geojedonensis TaxID=1123756 RepID=A0A1X4NHL2_9RHOB|nr:cyclic nucleotide-binding domain-containing protein [Marivita geojedonensis]OSQ46975.1 hypothetical protein MGEO_16390 [Marivita geojedonensis]